MGFAFIQDSSQVLALILYFLRIHRTCPQNACSLVARNTQAIKKTVTGATIEENPERYLGTKESPILTGLVDGVGSMSKK